MTVIRSPKLLAQELGCDLLSTSHGKAWALPDPGPQALRSSCPKRRAGMLTFECRLQQLLSRCVKRLDFILISAGLSHDGLAPAVFHWPETNDST